MKIRIKTQRHLCVAHVAEDNGDWVFTICRRGCEEWIGRRLKVGEVAVIDVHADIVEHITSDS